MRTYRVTATFDVEAPDEQRAVDYVRSLVRKAEHAGGDDPDCVLEDWTTREVV
jgi:hypothetical protein